MSGSLNLTVLIGRLGRDPEIRVQQSGEPVANLSVATSERWTKDGQKQERTEWHNVAVFGQAAKFVRDYATKGALVCIEGSIRYESWKDADGNEKKRTVIRAQRVELLSGGKPQADATAGPQRPLPAEPFQATDDDVPF